MKSVDAYLKKVEPKRRADLAKLREIVKKAIPAAVETTRHNMPSYELGDEAVVSCASQKNYMALYVCETDILDQHRDALSHLDVGKSCIRFKSLDDLPLKTVRAILRETARRG